MTPAAGPTPPMGPAAVFLSARGAGLPASFARMSLDRARALIRDIPDFPQPGILFKDITPVLGDPAAFRAVIDAMAEVVRARKAQRVAAIESRGFLFGAAVADRLGLGLAPVRKLGKLPYKTDRIQYALEYGTGTLEAHVDAVQPGERVVVIDDLLATGGTAWAAGQLVEKQRGVVAGYLFGIELAFLKGRERIAPGGAPVDALIVY